MRGRQAAAEHPSGDDGPDALSRLLADDPQEAARIRERLGPLASDQAAAAEAAAAWLLAEAPPPPADLVDRVMDRLAPQDSESLGTGSAPRSDPAEAAHRSRWSFLAQRPRPRRLLLSFGLAALALAIGLSLRAGADGGLSGAVLGQGTSAYLPAAAFSLILGLVLIVLSGRRR